MLDTHATMTSSTPQSRQQILEQIAQIETMEHGTLAEEYRQKAAPKGGILRSGPYFKHQAWEDGANRSRRVPADQVAGLREDIENHSRFCQLVDSYEKLVIAETRSQRSTQRATVKPDSKKNSKIGRSANATPKPKRSSK